jgi:hypothetical protein
MTVQAAHLKISPVEHFKSLKKARKGSNGWWNACCPAHADSSPSLGFKEQENGDVGFVCRAGCDKENILAAMGLEWSDVFASSMTLESRLQYHRKHLEAEIYHLRTLVNIASSKPGDLMESDIPVAAQAVDRLPKAEAELQAMTDSDQEEDQPPAPAFDNELPGRLADLQLAIFDRMRKPSALGAAMVALTVCGHLLGRRVLGPTNLGCNLQTIICAATGRGKDSLVGTPEWLMKPLGETLQATIAGQFASRPALHEHLMQQPCTLASIDEVGHMLKAIGNPSNAHMHDLGGFIMELFSSASKMIIPRGRRKAKGVVDLEPVKHPHFSLVGATTPAMLGLALTSDMTAAGQLNRLLICCLDDWNGHRQKPRFNAAPGWWAGWANDLQANYPDPGLHGEPLKMSWTKDADAFFWSEEERRDDALEGQADMVQQLRRRDCEHALKIAQVVALSDFKTEVTRSHLEWAFSFVDRLQWAVLDLCRAEGILQGSSLDAVAKTAADHLRKHGPKTEARLAADCRVFGATKSGDRAHVMRIMRESFGMTSNATGRTFKLAVR